MQSADGAFTCVETKRIVTSKPKTKNAIALILYVELYVHIARRNKEKKSLKLVMFFEVDWK
jgi:hypothetical protein